MKLKEIIQVLEEFAPGIYQESYDNSGLIVGSPDDEVGGALISLDCTEAVVDEAIRKNIKLVIAHHPIVFSGMKRFNGANYVERTLMKAIKNDVAIYAIHTNLDNAYQGVSFKLAEKMGLINCKILSPKKGCLQKLRVFVPQKNLDDVRAALFKGGAGHIGDYDNCSYTIHGTGSFRGGEASNPHVGKKGQLHFEEEAAIEVIFPLHKQKAVIKSLLEVHPYEEVAYDLFSLENEYLRLGSGVVGELEKETDTLAFLKELKKITNTAAIRHTDIIKKKIKRVALCGGSGSFLLQNAIHSGADLYISADFKYHEFFDADSKIIIADIGHYESEQFTTELIYDTLMKKITNFAVHLSEVKTNPVNYL